jgi:hypothetical protein
MQGMPALLLLAADGDASSQPGLCIYDVLARN